MEGVGFLVGYLVFVGLIFLLTAAGKWKVFEKAGEPGWAAIVPIYEFYVSVQIARKEMTWFVLFVIGFVICFPLGIVALFVVNTEIAKKFGKDVGYGIGLTLLPFVFYPMLGFSDARYQGGRQRAIDDFDDDDDDAPPPPRKRKPSRDDDF